MFSIQQRLIDDQKKYPLEKYRFIDPVSGYKCSIVRNSEELYYLAYVQLPKEHPDYKKHYSELNISSNRYLTYSRKGKFGFDCDQSDDFNPGMYLSEYYRRNLQIAEERGIIYHYLTFEEVKVEILKISQEFFKRK